MTLLTENQTEGVVAGAKAAVVAGFATAIPTVSILAYFSLLLYSIYFLFSFVIQLIY